MNAFRDTGFVLAIAIVVAGTALVGAVRPAAMLASSYSDQDYALDALALEYLGDYVEDPLLRSWIARSYWCWTPVESELAHGGPEDLTEKALRARAQAMAQRYAGLRCRVTNSSGRTLSAKEVADVSNASAYLVRNRRIECDGDGSADN